MRSFVLVGLVFAVIVFGCGGNDSDQVEDGCESGSDCDDGQICVDGECVVPGSEGCEKDTDCKGGRICEEGACVYPPDSRGRTNSDAQAGTGGSSDAGMDAGGREADADAKKPDFDSSSDAGTDVNLDQDSSVEQKNASTEPSRYSLDSIEKTVEIAIPQNLAIYLMLDKSASMTEGEPTKWSIAVDAIKAFVEDVDSASIKIALQYFPIDSTACDGTDYDTPEVPMGFPTDNAADIASSLDAVDLEASIFTPIEPALKGIISFCSQFQAQHSDTTCVGILISDGEPTRCSTDAYALIDISHNGYDSLDVRTFAVGMEGADFVLLNQIAMFGGTDCTPDNTDDGYACDLTSGMSLIDALDTIRGQFSEVESYLANQTLDCEWRIPTPPRGSTFDRDMVNLVFSNTGSENDERTIGRVLSSAQCDDVSEGWFYDNPEKPERIIVYPDLCVTIQNAEVETISLLYPSETVMAAGGDYCPNGFGDCDGDDTNGCETPLTSLTDCGACSVPCGESSCAGGECTQESCATGFANCDGEADNGCETSLETTSNCGMCDLECGPLPNAEATCEFAVCEIASCEGGFHDCDQNPVNGCESELKDNLNCGACNKPCGYANAKTSCATGSCEFLECATGFQDCNGDLDDGCEVDVDNDEDRCGDCDESCLSGQMCFKGQCRCATEYEKLCGGDCVDCASDEQNCGGCGNRCDQTCCGGDCVDTESDVSHCGRCSHSCHPGFSCVDGTCVCDDDDDCQGRTCCDGECVNTNGDPDNCGTCGNVCSEGGCCPTDTGGTCVDFQSDPNNCGECNITCSILTGPLCCSGTCEDECT